MSYTVQIKTLFPAQRSYQRSKEEPETQFGSEPSYL